MSTTPQRRARPANRRQQILDAASAMFGTRGYEGVAMSDIAGAVGVQPSALYRHFSSKEKLLDEILDRSVSELESVISRPELTTPGGLLSLAEYAIDNRHVSGLIGRDLPHLSVESRHHIQERLRQVSSLLAERVSTAPVRSGPAPTARPLKAHEGEVLAQAVLAILQSPAFYHLQQPRAELCSELTLLIKRVASADLSSPIGEAVQGKRSGLMPLSRREALLGRAVTLFAERTYAKVRVEDVAASLDIAGPSVYNHFKSKSEILATALERNAAYLLMQTADTLATATEPAAAFRALLSSYSRFAVDHPGIVDLMISETASLPEPSRETVIGAARQNVDEMVHLLRQVHPDLSLPAARVQVQAALMIPNNIARISSLRSLSGITEAVAEICVKSLALPLAGP